MFGANPSPEGRGWREAPGEGYHKHFFILYPSPAASQHPLPLGEGFDPNLFLIPVDQAPRRNLRAASVRIEAATDRARGDHRLAEILWRGHTAEAEVDGRREAQASELAPFEDRPDKRRELQSCGATSRTLINHLPFTRSRWLTLRPAAARRGGSF